MGTRNLTRAIQSRTTHSIQGRPQTCRIRCSRLRRPAARVGRRCRPSYRTCKTSSATPTSDTETRLCRGDDTHSRRAEGDAMTRKSPLFQCARLLLVLVAVTAIVGGAFAQLPGTGNVPQYAPPFDMIGFIQKAT